MFQVSIVLQQFSHHLDVALLRCRDQRRPAVLHKQTTCYHGNSEQSPNPVGKSSLRSLQDGPGITQSTVPTSWSYQVLMGTRCRIDRQECRSVKKSETMGWNASFFFCVTARVSTSVSVLCVITGNSRLHVWDVNERCTVWACVCLSERVYVCVSVCVHRGPAYGGKGCWPSKWILWCSQRSEGKSVS